MRRYLKFFLIVFFPYLIVFALICTFNGCLIDTVFHHNVYPLLLILIVLYAVALVCAVTTFIASLAKKRKLQEVLRINMIIKLIHIPAYLFILVVGLFCMITIFTFGITIVLMMFYGATIVLSGVIGLGGVIRSLRENKISIKVAVIHGILQFVFCADIISSIIMYRKVKVTK